MEEILLKEAVAYCAEREQTVTIGQLRKEIDRGHIVARNSNPQKPRRGDTLINRASLDQWLNTPRQRGRPAKKPD